MLVRLLSNRKYLLSFVYFVQLGIFLEGQYSVISFIVVPFKTYHKDPCLDGITGIRLRRSIKCFSRTLKEQSDSHNQQESFDNRTMACRRTFISSKLATLSLQAALLLDPLVEPANAYERAYPLELNSMDAIGLSDARKMKITKQLNLQTDQSIQSINSSTNKFSSSFLWGCALWFWSGSRSNPIATPLANFIYKREDEQWLQDRNDGWFAALPWEFLIILFVVFLGFGYIIDCILLFVSEGFSIDESLFNTTTTLSLQLATVLLIAGGSFELGRIFSGEKLATKKEADRLAMLQNEFEIFAEKRLIVVGKVNAKNTAHRNEITACFRRFYSKYRLRPEFNAGIVNGSNNTLSVTDLEIERLLREWARDKPFVDMTSAGFYNGIQINKDADVFVNR